MTDPVPPQAITAALGAVAKHGDMHLWLTAAEGTIGGLLARKELFTRAILAAAPHLTAGQDTARAEDGGYEPFVAAGPPETEIRVVPESAVDAARAEERERIYAELGNDHYVIFTEDRWTMEHSVECRLSGQMHQCAYHAAIAEIADEYDPDNLGRWRIDDIDSEGLPSLTRANGQP